METEDANENYASTSTLTSLLPAGITEAFFALNIFLSITTFLGNALILVALHKASSVHPPTKLLFRCLAVTDLCVGLVTQPLGAIAFYSPFLTGISKKIVHDILLVNSASV